MKPVENERNILHMKKLSPKAELKKVNKDFNRVCRQMRYAHHGIKPQLNSVKLPTPQQLAALAATLARHVNADLTKLCSEAMHLWAAAHEHVALQRQCNKDWQIQAAQNEADKITLNEPKQFPVKLDLFLRLVLPKRLVGRTADRAEIYKLWLRGVIAEERSGRVNPPAEFTPTQEEVIERYSKECGELIDKRAYHSRGYWLLQWYERWRGKETSRKRRCYGRVIVSRE